MGTINGNIKMVGNINYIPNSKVDSMLVHYDWSISTSRWSTLRYYSRFHCFVCYHETFLAITLTFQLSLSYYCLLRVTLLLYWRNGMFSCCYPSLWLSSPLHCHNRTLSCRHCLRRLRVRAAPIDLEPMICLPSLVVYSKNCSRLSVPRFCHHTSSGSQSKLLTSRQRS